MLSSSTFSKICVQIAPMLLWSDGPKFLREQHPKDLLFQVKRHQWQLQNSVRDDTERQEIPQQVDHDLAFSMAQRGFELSSLS